MLTAAPSYPMLLHPCRQDVFHWRLGHLPTPITELPLPRPPIPPTASLPTALFSTSLSSSPGATPASSVTSAGLGNTNLRASGRWSKGVFVSLARRRRERVRRRKTRWQTKMPASSRRLVGEEIVLVDGGGLKRWSEKDGGERGLEDDGLFMLGGGLHDDVLNASENIKGTLCD